MKEVALRTAERRVLVDITGDLGRAADQDGVWLAFVPHTTAGIAINEGADPAVARDVLARLEALAPDDADYEHAEGNAPAHVMATLVGSSVLFRVQRGQVRLGRWQSIFFCEFDGPRTRKVQLTRLGG